MEKEQRAVQDANDQTKPVSNTSEKNSQSEQINRAPSEIDQQEGNMSNGELGGNLGSDSNENNS